MNDSFGKNSGPIKSGLADILSFFFGLERVGRSIANPFLGTGGWLILCRLVYSGRIICAFSAMCIFNIQVHNLCSFKKLQCVLQLISIYWLVYLCISTILLTFVKMVFLKKHVGPFARWFILCIFLGDNWKITSGARYLAGEKKHFPFAKVRFSY